MSRWFRGVLYGAAFFYAPAAHAAATSYWWDTRIPTLSAYGGVGLLDMRTARFMPDGYLSATVSAAGPETRIPLTFQAFPWAEVTFRYAINDDVLETGDRLYDRSFDLKLLLMRETERLPQIAVGFQDFIGTGVYSAEYVVASKILGPFDLTLGVGWGRLASRGTFQNPFLVFGEGFRSREIDVRQGGGLTLNYFHGPDMGLFGGVEYTTPIRGVRLQVEYSSDAFTREERSSGIDYGFPVNFGISYRPWTWLDVGLSFMRGRDVGLRVSTFVDPTSAIWPARLDRPPRFEARPDDVREALARRDVSTGNSGGIENRFVDLTRPEIQPSPATPLTPPESPPPGPQAGAGPLVPGLPEVPPPEPDAEAAIRDGLQNQGLVVMGLELTADRLKVTIENGQYRRDAEAIARAARVLTATAPAAVETFEITTVAAGMALTTTVLPRQQLEAIGERQAVPEEVWQASTLAPAIAPDYLDSALYPRVQTDFYPSIRYSLFDPENPLYLQLGVGASGSVEVARGLVLETTLFGTIYDNLPDQPRESDSVLPHVRSDAQKYLREGRYSIFSLSGSYYFKPAADVYARVSAGYLEWMYAGFGGELLYRPFGQRWALGADLWALRQREYNQLLDLRRYETITGHLSAYYDSPWYGLRFAIHAGRYLAGDYGATFELVRQFDTGVRIGAWFTLTDVSPQEFGEGSFDKGIRIVIPLEWAAPFSTRSVYDLELRPIQRDGGQMMLGNKRLYGITDGSDYGELSRQWGSVFRP